VARPDVAPLTAGSTRVRQASHLSKRAVRARRREFLAEGPPSVREALQRAGAVREVFATASIEARHPELRAAAGAQGVSWHSVADDVVAALTDTVTPQGVVARCAFVDVTAAALLARVPRLLALLHEVRDPGNAGTVLRCADAAGADGLLLSGSSVDPYNSKAVRASAGSLFHLPLVTGVALEATVSALRDNGLRVLAADAGGDVDLAVASDRGALRGPAVWLFGNEARGLSEESRSLADSVVRVPLYGRAESLNLESAAAVCLYASAWAQRRPGGCRAGRPEQ